FNSNGGCTGVGGLYSYLSFKVRGLAGGENFNVDWYSRDPACSFAPVLGSTSLGSWLSVGTAWQEVQIPVATFGGGPRLDRIEFSNFSPGSGGVEIDDIRLEALAFTPTPSASPSPSAT